MALLRRTNRFLLYLLAGGFMRKFLVAMGAAAMLFAACGDDSSSSTGPNDEPGVESSSSVEQDSSSSSSAKSSSSVTPQSSSSETRVSSSSVDDASSSSVKSSSSSSVILSASDESSSSSAKSSSSVTPSSSSWSSEGTIGSSSSSVEEPPISSETESSSSSSEVNCSALLEGETGWSWDVPKECRFNPDIDYGTMTDERDGKVYRTVTIGKQTWMAENLNYYDSTDLSVKKKSWCFGKKDNGDSSTCDVAGRLYTWAAAMDSAGVWSTNGKGCGYNRPCSSTAPVRGICPEGWHLPTSYEFDLLRLAVGGTSISGEVLKSTSGWDDYDGESGNGTDSFGFSALPAGYGNLNGYFDNDGKYANFWTSTDFNIYNAYLLYFSYNLDETRSSYTETEVIFSVRCLKN